MKNRIFKLQIFRGTVAYDEKGVPTSENQPMKLEHNTVQFTQFLTSAKQIGISKIKVLGLVTGVDESGKEVLDSNPSDAEYAAIAESIEKCVSDPKKSLTAEERVKQLEEQLAKMQSGMSASVKPTETAGDDIEQIRKQYYEVTGKKPHHLKSADVLKAEIAEKLNA